MSPARPPYCSPRHATRAMVLGLALIVVVVLPGCNIIGFFYTALSPPETVPAAYTLPNRYTAVVVDDPGQVLDNPSLQGVVAANVAFNLNRILGPGAKLRKANKDRRFTAGFVPQSELANLMSRTGDQYEGLAIDEIGRRVGAQQVIYINFQSFGVPAHIALDRPSAVVRVRVVDAETGERLFPAVAPAAGETRVGYPVKAELDGPYDQTQAGIGRVIQRDLAQKLGLQIARQFFDWVRPDVGSTLPG